MSKPQALLRNLEGLKNSHYWKSYLTRLANGRDMHTVITAKGETGVGKTMAAFTLCTLGETILGRNWTVDKATLSAAEYANKYDAKVFCSEHEGQDIDIDTFEGCSDCEYKYPPGSWFLGDEWEQAVDTRRSMSQENVEASHRVATMRYRQIFAAYTAPSKSWIDNRFGNDAVDYWIQVQDGPHGQVLGDAKVYRVQTNEHRDQPYYEQVETFSWPDLSDRREWDKLRMKKIHRLQGQMQSAYVHREEVEEMKANFWNKATKQARFGLVKSMYEHGLTQEKISQITQQAEHVEGLSRRRISDLVTADGFDEVYTG